MKSFQQFIKESKVLGREEFQKRLESGEKFTHANLYIHKIKEDQFQHGDPVHDIPELPFEKNPKIGWWRDQSHLTMYHGTHVSTLPKIDKDGLRAGENAQGWVSMTHDPHTAKGYASMHGGENSYRGFRGVGGKPVNVPHKDRRILVAHIPKEWAEKNMDPRIRGNTSDYKKKLVDRSEYDKHAASGKPDFQHYQGTELRFPSVPREFIKGYMKDPTKD